MSRLAQGFVLGALEVGENCAWCLVIVAIFVGLGRAKRWGEEVLKASYRRSRNKVVDPSRHQVIFLGTGIPFLHYFNCINT